MDATKSQLSGGDRLILQIVEVPQANGLLKVFKVAKLIADGANTPAEVAAVFDLVDRGSAHHLSAACALRLVRKLPRGEAAEYVLSHVGDSHLEARGTRRELRLW